MTLAPPRLAALLFAVGVLLSGTVLADDVAGEPAQPPGLIERYTGNVTQGVNDTLQKALDLIGIRYRRGGTSPTTGFDCSGFVKHVFAEGLGLVLPHSARAMAQSGDVVDKAELQPGDLVFFRTVRRAISHVGIYLGDHQFIHAPATGGEVRVEDMRENYWVKHYAGARRMTAN
jgi:cell wall-associated NlpC family hydrolase